jgi:hypothetical protein
MSWDNKTDHPLFCFRLPIYVDPVQDFVQDNFIRDAPVPGYRARKEFVLGYGSFRLIPRLTTVFGLFSGSTGGIERDASLSHAAVPQDSPLQAVKGFGVGNGERR